MKQHATHGDPASVVAAIDAFASTNRMMNVGITKGAIVDNEIRKKKPTVMAELGGYTGYSAVRFASLQREVAGTNASHYYSFEYSPVFAARVREVRPHTMSSMQTRKRWRLTVSVAMGC